MLSVARMSLMSGTCPLKGSGLASRVPLYVGRTSVRNEARPASNATATCVGFSSRSRFVSIDVNPKTAFVDCPVVVENFSTGRAK